MIFTHGRGRRVPVAGTARAAPAAVLLAKLRERSPGKSDRSLLEEIAAVTLGFETIHRVQRRTAEAGVDQEEIEGEAVRVVRRHYIGLTPRFCT